MSLSWFLECITVLMWQIATVFGRASTRLQYSQSPGREVPNRSSTGTSKWQSWRLSFVAEVTNEDHATQEWYDRIFLHQWWILPPHSGHFADVAGDPRWHHIIDCCSSQADLPRTPVPTSWLHQSSMSFWWPAAASTGKNMNGKLLSRDPAWSADCQNELQDWTPWLKIERWQTTAGAPQCRLWPAAVAIQSISLVSSPHSSWVCCSSSTIQSSPCSWQTVGQPSEHLRLPEILFTTVTSLSTFKPLLRSAQNRLQVFFFYIGWVYHVCLLWLFTNHQRRKIVWTPLFWAGDATADRSGTWRTSCGISCMLSRNMF